MTSYLYDDTGAVFGVFVVALLAAILLPTTYYTLRSGAGKRRELAKEPSYGTDADVRKRTVLHSRLASGTRSRLTISTILLLIGWTALALFALRAFCATSAETHVYDPYEVLGIAPGAQEPEIKRAMKKLMMRWHPDRNRDNQEEATQMSTNINLAVKALLDPIARANWEQWGHPDGRQSFGVGLALPVGIIKHSVFAVLAYVVGLMVILPLIVARWWSRARSVTRSDVFKRTVSTYFKDRKTLVEGNFYSAIQLISYAEEFEALLTLDDFQEESFLSLAKNVKDAVAISFDKNGDAVVEKELPLLAKHVQAITLASEALAYKANILLLAHIMRIDVAKYSSKLYEEQVSIVVATPKLLKVATDIIGVSEPYPIVSLLLTAAQRFHQALPIGKLPISEVPYLETESVLTELKKTNLPDYKLAPGESDVISVPQHLMNLPITQQRELLSRFLSADKVNTVLKIVPEFPQIQIKQAKFYVPGHPAIYPSSLVSLNVAMEMPKIDNMNNKTGFKPVELDNSELLELPPRKLFQEAERGPVYAPQFPATRYGTTFIFLTRAVNDNRVLISFAAVFDLYPGGPFRIARLQFDAPSSPGRWDFDIFVVSDSYCGSLNSVSQKLVVEALPDNLPEEDDDISDPDEETFEGQMALFKGQKVKKRGKVQQGASHGTPTAAKQSAAAAAVSAKLADMQMKRAKKPKGGAADGPTSPGSVNPNVSKVQRRVKKEKKPASALSPSSEKPKEDKYGRLVSDAELVDTDSELDEDEDEEDYVE